MMGSPRWPAAEVDRLQALWPSLPLSELARQMGKRAAQVKGMGYKLGLHKAKTRQCSVEDCENWLRVTNRHGLCRRHKDVGRAWKDRRAKKILEEMEMIRKAKAQWFPRGLFEREAA
jgi:hypothetical protein